MRISLFLFSVLVLFYMVCIILLIDQKVYSSGIIQLSPLQNGINSTKLIILAFDDSSKTQFTLAKPILDKYGYKGSFFTVCSYVNEGSQDKGSRMSWQDIKTLQQQGHDI